MPPRGRSHAIARTRSSIALPGRTWTGAPASPDLAMRRNAEAVEELARACARTGASLLVVSTNEVFDGERTDGRGYQEEDADRSAQPLRRQQAGR